VRALSGLCCIVAICIAIGGCETGNAGMDPGARALPAGQTCESIHGELTRLDARGVPAYVERASSGAKLSAQQKADVDRYNDLLNQYLGARCHVAAT
jgi:hypothetical protein